MEKVLASICSIFFLVYSILAFAEEVQLPDTEIKDLAKEAQYHAELDGYNVFYSLTEDEAYEKGKELATSDFKNGNYRVLVYGLRPLEASSEKYLNEKYNVKTYPIAGCIVSEGIIGGADGYNVTMKAFLLKKFGKDVFSEAESLEGVGSD